MLRSLERILQRAAKWPAKRRHWSVNPRYVFDESNDHNPLILDECPRCRGRGAHDQWGRNEQDEACQQLVSCSLCNGSGTTGQQVRYFDNDSPTIDVPLRAGGWITCPCCKW